MFIDSDCEIRERAPTLEPFCRESGVFMALGRSGRFNSGVIAARHGKEAIRFLQASLDSLSDQIPEADRFGLKYENGNLIRCARLLGGVTELDPRWNNTSPEITDDYVRHYTGPMREKYHAPLLSRPVLRLIQTMVDAPRAAPSRRSQSFQVALDSLAKRSSARYPTLVHPDGKP
jgi:hypothetical protein